MKGIPAPNENIGKGKFHEKKQKKLVDVFLLTIIILLLAIVLYVIVTVVSQEQEDGSGTGLSNWTVSDDTNTSDGTEEEDSEEYILGMAVANKDVTLCEELETKKQECYVALANYSEEACLKVEDYADKKECILNHVESKGSTLLCNQLEEEDQEECGLLVDPCYGKVTGERELCLAVAYGKYSYCMDENCLFEYAEQTKDEEVCEVFDAPAESYACYSLIEGKNRCEELVLVMQQDYCYYLYGTKADASYYCEEISSDNAYAYLCYYEFAVKENDYTFCEQIEDFNEKWKCMKNYALETGDIAGCDNIHELAISNYESCYFNFAIEYSLPVYCKKLKNPSSQDSCFAQSIQDMSKPLDPVNCANITDSTWIDNCYKYAAWKNDDITICDDIVNTNTKILCLNEFEENEE